MTYGAKIEFTVEDGGNGFCAPDLPQDMKDIVYQSTKECFDGKDPIFSGCGGSIPFMEIFAQEFPNAKYLLTGAATIDGNAHSPNEFLNLEYCKKFITTVGLILSRL